MSTTFDVARVRIGIATVPLLDEKQVNFYRQAVRAVTGEAATFVGDDRPWECLTTETANYQTDFVLEVVKRSLTTSSSEAQVVLVDLSLATLQLPAANSSLRGAAVVRAIEALHEYLQETPPEVGLLVLVDELPPVDDLMCVLLDEFLRDGRIRFLADSGDALPGLSNRRNGAAYRREIANQRGDDVVSMRSTLIKRKGWFRRGPGRLVRYFYDLSAAPEELDHELFRLLRDLPSDCTMIYSSEVSHWLEEPLQSARLRLGWNATAPLLNVLEVADVVSLLDQNPNSHTCVIIVPMVDTGDTLKRLILAIRNTRPDINLRVFAILSTGGLIALRGRRTLGPGFTEDVHYLLRVEQIHIDFAMEECDLRVLELAESVPSLDHGQMSSYEFWDVVLEQNCIPERDVPEWRPPDESEGVPDFNALLRSGFGPWLSTRLWGLLEGEVGPVSRDALVVCPEGEETSDSLADFLEKCLGVRVIRIPRSTITAVKRAGRGSTIGQPLWQETLQPWQRMLLGSNEADIIILDDFIVSGDTMKALKEILTGGGFEVAAIACICDWRVNNEDIGTIKSLYKFSRPRVPVP